ncbi:MAG: [FeFe] hydrogenase H-cluster maturation GTPase HydF [Bacteroidales bacterium]|jgi:predicted GTPase|nr:[FeFe] hydrogenase H-cluster maturation GTPase HydF [Bacteroidales bacterium]
MERLHIAFFGPTNSGKSTLVNALAGQQVSLVSPIPGTTTDPVRKIIELPELGPCVLIDTAGLGDGSTLGVERERLTRAIFDETDVAVVIENAGDSSGGVPPEPPAPPRSERSVSIIPALIRNLEAAGIPVVRYTRGESVDSLLRRLVAAAPREEEKFLTGNLVHAGSSVLLVMPQDSEAPKGRLILPQVQVLRELLDRGCVPHSCTPESLQAALDSLSGLPDLVITDSQVFGLVDRSLPKDCPLTSFSVLLAAAKGDIRTFVAGAGAIDTLKPGSRVLIAEACTHVPDTEDIGRVKIPALLRKRVGELTVDVSAGNDFPEDLSPYSLIIHCGACVANARLVRSRIRKALLAGVPITNYGIALAALNGILGRIAIPV